MLLFGELTVIGERGGTIRDATLWRTHCNRRKRSQSQWWPEAAENVTAALSRKTVLLVIHHVDFLPAFDAVLFGEIDDIAYGNTPPCFLCTTQLPFQLVRYLSNYFQRIYFWSSSTWIRNRLYTPCLDPRVAKVVGVIYHVSLTKCVSMKLVHKI